MMTLIDEGGDDEKSKSSWEWSLVVRVWDGNNKMENIRNKQYGNTHSVLIRLGVVVRKKEDSTLEPNVKRQMIIVSSVGWIPYPVQAKQLLSRYFLRTNEWYFWPQVEVSIDK